MVNSCGKTMVIFKCLQQKSRNSQIHSQFLTKKTMKKLNATLISVVWKKYKIP